MNIGTSQLLQNNHLPSPHKGSPTFPKDQQGTFIDLVDDDRGLSTTAQQQLIKQIQSTSNNGRKQHVLDFSGESNGAAFIYWVLQVESLLDYKNYGDPKCVLLKEIKLKRRLALVV